MHTPSDKSTKKKAKLVVTSNDDKEDNFKYVELGDKLKAEKKVVHARRREREREFSYISYMHAKWLVYGLSGYGSSCYT